MACYLYWLAGDLFIREREERRELEKSQPDKKNATENKTSDNIALASLVDNDVGV